MDAVSADMQMGSVSEGLLNAYVANAADLGLSTILEKFGSHYAIQQETRRRKGELERRFKQMDGFLERVKTYRNSVGLGQQPMNNMQNGQWNNQGMPMQQGFQQPMQQQWQQPGGFNQGFNQGMQMGFNQQPMQQQWQQPGMQMGFNGQRQYQQPGVPMNGFQQPQGFGGQQMQQGFQQPGMPMQNNMMGQPMPQATGFNNNQMQGNMQQGMGVGVTNNQTGQLSQQPVPGLHAVVPGKSDQQDRIVRKSAEIKDTDITEYSAGGGAPRVTQTLEQQKSSHQNLNDQNYQAPIPKTADEIVFDPAYYIPEGVTINEERPYDLFYAPGGIKVYARGKFIDEGLSFGKPFEPFTPYSSMAFVICWGDGTLEDYIVERISPDMRYLQHELIEALRVSSRQTRGRVVCALDNIQHTQLGQKVEEPEYDLTDDAEDTIAEIEEPIFATSDSDCFSIVCEASQFDESFPVVYKRAANYPLGRFNGDEVFHVQHGLTATTFEGVISAMVNLLNNERINAGVFTALNKRFTDAVNSFLADDLSTDYTIDHFVDDYAELLDVLRSENMGDLIEVIESNQADIIKRVVMIDSAPVEEEIQTKDDDGNDQIETIATGEEELNILDIEETLLVPLHSTSFACFTDKYATVVSAKLYPNLRTQLNECLQTVECHKATRAIMVTSDQVRFAVSRGAYRGEILMRRL